ncbi:diguanylate cyclase domain-containing protein [Hydrogenophaga sp. RWCD_12]|uniref:diguanylate cyclase domain-containing protein n=1 Tax=Hydrogenophaga sp. RWCD_12 TaxID=3391190 RepID=UPI003984B88F
MTIKPKPTIDMSDAMATEAARAWQDLLAVTPPKVRQAVADVVRDGAVTLTDEFYERMMRSERATHFLDQERVQKRLRASLQQWMTDLFEVEVDLEQAIGRQIEVGAVHARIRLPIDLIPAGIRVLKRGIRRRIDFAPLDPSDRLLALVYVSDLLHLADGLMNQAYFHDAQDVVRNDEAYRLVTQKRSASLERARQRAALSEWTEALLLSVWAASPPRAFVRLRDAEFGIWLHHKGAILFDNSEDFRSLLESIDTMDQALLPRLMDAGQDRQRTDAAIVAIKQLLDLIRFKLNELFDRAGSQDDGLDIETHLPDRRYLPAILANVMRTHHDSGRPCCLLLVEVQLPAFKGLTASGTRSRLLQVAATTLIDCTRTSDHLFRFDEQRFLMIAVECDRSKSTQLANTVSEELRNALQAGNIQGSWTPVQTTVAIGIAEYDRHPDYQYLIQRAESALAEATSGNSRARIAFA